MLSQMLSQQAVSFKKKKKKENQTAPSATFNILLALQNQIKNMEIEC